LGEPGDGDDPIYIPPHQTIAADVGVVRWWEGDTIYISSQRKGKKVVAPPNSCDLFQGMNYLETFDGTMLDVSNVTNMASMFDWCPNLVELVGLETWNVSQVQSMESMFDGCESLADVNALQDWDVKNVADMRWMFVNCSSLCNLNGLKHWDVSRVERMDSMFKGCSALTSVDAIAEWDVSNVEWMPSMFKDCKSLKNVDGLRDWNMRKVVHHVGHDILTGDVFEYWEAHTKHMDKIFDGCESLSSLPRWYELRYCAYDPSYDKPEHKIH
jgi:surface protein